MRDGASQSVLDSLFSGFISGRGEFQIGKIEAYGTGCCREVEPVSMLEREILTDIPDALYENHVVLQADFPGSGGNGFGTRQAIKTGQFSACRFDA